MCKQENTRFQQNGAAASEGGSAAPSADARRRSLAQIRQNPFWQAALTSQSILLWIATNLNASEWFQGTP